MDYMEQAAAAQFVAEAKAAADICRAAELAVKRAQKAYGSAKDSYLFETANSMRCTDAAIGMLQDVQDDLYELATRASYLATTGAN